MPAVSARSGFAFALALALATPAAAQTIHGELVEQGTGTPVPGAFVVLLDEAGEQRDAALTDADGRFLLGAPLPGRYTLGLDRIGYYSTQTDPILLSEGQVVRYRLETIVEPVALDDIEVAVESECRVRPDEGRAVARVWEEARKALNATAFTQQMGLLRYSVVARERVLDPYSFRVREESERRRSGVTHGSPYVALPPAVLADTGYARLGDEEQIYYGPDAATLLSDEFLDTHCLSLREGPSGDGENRIGIAFEPVREQRLPDIRGTLWLDERTAELDRLEYTYTNLPPAIAGRGAGGEVDFERLPTGEWIIRQWHIRMPVLRLPDTGMYSHLSMDPNERIATVARIKEDSGEVVDIVPARGDGGARRVWSQAIDWRPAFAAIAAAEAAAAARATTVGGLCPPGVVEAGESALSGVVRDSLSGTRLPGARVAVAWGDPRTREEPLTVLSDREGWFVACGVPTGVPLDVVTSFPGRIGETTLVVPDGADLHEVSLAVTGEAAIEAPRLRSVVAVRRETDREGGVLTGTVVDAAGGAPLAGAQVTLPGLGTGATTGSEGRFRVAGVPAGTHGLRVEYLGYEPATVRFEASAEAATRVEARLVPTPIAVAALEVAVPSTAVEAERARGHAAWRLTSEDIPENTTVSLAELLDRRFAGFVLLRSRFSSCPIVEVRRREVSLVILDGQPFYDTCVLDHVLPQDIDSIEIYPGLAGGIAVGRSSGAGAIVIETRHSGE